MTEHLQIFEDGKKEFKVKNLQEYVVTSIAECFDLLK
jgi:hypothetical protein